MFNKQAGHPRFGARRYDFDDFTGLRVNPFAW